MTTDRGEFEPNNYVYEGVPYQQYNNKPQYSIDAEEGYTPFNKEQVSSTIQHENIMKIEPPNITEYHIYGELGATEYAWECLGQSNDNMYRDAVSSNIIGSAPNLSFQAYIKNITLFLQLHITNISYILLNKPNNVRYNINPEYIPRQFTELVTNNKSEKLDHIIYFSIGLITNMLGRIKKVKHAKYWGNYYLYKTYLRSSITDILELIAKLNGCASSDELGLNILDNYFNYIVDKSFISYAKIFLKSNIKVSVQSDIKNANSEFIYEKFNSVNDYMKTIDNIINSDRSVYPNKSIQSQLFDYVIRYINNNDIDTDYYLLNNIDNILKTFEQSPTTWTWDIFEYISHYLYKLYYNPNLTDYNNKNDEMMTNILKTFYQGFLNNTNIKGSTSGTDIGNFNTTIHESIHIHNNIYAKGGNCYKYVLRNILNTNPNLKNTNPELYNTIVKESATLSDWDFSIHSDIHHQNGYKVDDKEYKKYMLDYTYNKFNTSPNTYADIYAQNDSYKLNMDIQLTTYEKGYIANRNYINKQLINCFKDTIIVNNNDIINTVNTALKSENNIINDNNVVNYVKLIAVKSNKFKVFSIALNTVNLFLDNVEVLTYIHKTKEVLKSILKDISRKVEFVEGNIDFSPYNNIDFEKDLPSNVLNVHDHNIIINNAIYGIDSSIYKNAVISKFDLSRITIPYYIEFNLTNGYKYYLKTFSEYIDVSFVNKYNDLNESPLNTLKTPFLDDVCYTKMKMGNITVSSLSIISFLYDVIRMLYNNEAPNKHNKKLARLINIHNIIPFTEFKDSYKKLISGYYLKTKSDYNNYEINDYHTYNILDLLRNRYNNNISLQKEIKQYTDIITNYLKSNDHDNKYSVNDLDEKSISVGGIASYSMVAVYVFIICLICMLFMYIVRSKIHKQQNRYWCNNQTASLPYYGL